MTPKLSLFPVRLLRAVALGMGSAWSLAAGTFSDANWSALGSGMNNTVYALAVSGTNVYAAGNFSSAVARWNGSSWSPLGSGLNGPVYALAVSGTNVYVGGSFSTAGGASAHNIAKWNGSSWSALGGGMGVSPYYYANVNAVAVAGTNVYAAGSFGTAGFSTVNNIAKWNGSTWSALGSGTSGFSPSSDVLALAVSGNNLYVGGDFTTAGSVTVNHIAKWDGNFWTALGSGMGSGNAISVYAFAVSGTSVYAGGLFTTAGDNGAGDIARWNGSSWSALSVGMSATNYYPSLHALAMSGSDLYAGGDFTKAGGNPASRIAKWNGTNWMALGSGMNGTVRALAVSGSDLYVGGSFTTAGGKPAAYIARAYLPDLPELSMICSGSEITVSWPSVDTSGFALEHAGSLTALASWSTNTASVTDDGTNKWVTLPATNNSRFFRLRRP